MDISTYVHFLKKGKRINSISSVSLLKKEPSTFLLILMMDRLRVHTSKKTRAFLEAVAVRTFLLSLRFSGVHPIGSIETAKNLFYTHPQKPLMAGPHALLQMDSGELRGTPRLLNGMGRFIPEAELRVAATQSTKQSSVLPNARV